MFHFHASPAPISTCFMKEVCIQPSLSGNNPVDRTGLGLEMGTGDVEARRASGEMREGRSRGGFTFPSHCVFLKAGVCSQRAQSRDI